MTIHPTPEQVQRRQAVIGRGSYESVDELLGAALVAVEERTTSGFDGTDEELEALLLEGLASDAITDDEFWKSVNQQTDALLAEHASRKAS